MIYAGSVEGIKFSRLYLYIRLIKLSMNDETSKADEMSKNKSLGGIIANIVVVVAIVLVALYAVSAFTPLNILGINKQATSDNWKAVFLSNGQVYFGRIANERSNPVVLSDIYYLQVTQPLQQVGEGQQPAVASQPQLSLVKLGNELHGPEDQMRINKEHILFIEDLKSDSRVVEAINNYVAGQE